MSSVELRTLIVGLGKTGLSCARYLRAQGVPVAVVDSRAHPPGLDRAREEMPDLALFVGGFSPDVFAAAAQLVVSPGVPLSEPQVAAAMARGVPVVGDIELFARAAKAPVAAITGSNGKSTVTTLLGQMARQAGVRAAVGGNLGEPALDLLDDAVELYVLELSSFQLETTRSLAPRVATVLNVSADHMDRYADLTAYVAAKARILRGAATAVLNRDDPLVCAMLEGQRGRAEEEMDKGQGRKASSLVGRAEEERDKGQGKKTSSFALIPWPSPLGPRPLLKGFTLGAPQRDDDYGLAEHAGGTWLMRGRTPLIAAREVPLAGRHNLANALAALALGEACGLSRAPMIETLRNFHGLSHRTVLLADKAGVRWYDDSKGTNPGATVAALDGLIDPAGSPRAVLIAGGDGKGADFAPLAPAVERAARAVVLIGRDAPLIERVLAGRVALLYARDMETAVGLAARAARPGDCVLLSPACASFDMFDNYEHRGRVFAAAVERLPG